MNPAEQHLFVMGIPRYSDLGYIACVNRTLETERKEHTVLLDWDEGQFRA